jgi:hypothetical protein
LFDLFSFFLILNLNITIERKNYEKLPNMV